MNWAVLLSNDTTSFGAIVYFICSANVFVLQSDSLWIELAKLSTVDNSDQKGEKVRYITWLKNPHFQTAVDTQILLLCNGHGALDSLRFHEELQSILLQPSQLAYLTLTL